MKKEQGSIVVEAAIIMPMLLALVIVMIAFVQLAVTEMALQTAVSETSKYVAAHAYPLYLLSETDIGQDVQAIGERVREGRERWEAADSLAQDYAAFIPEPLLDLLGGHHLLDEMNHAAMNMIGMALLKPHVNEHIFEIDRLHVVHTVLPDLQSRERARFGLEVRYVKALRIPFFQREIAIHKSAYERVWIGA